MRSATTKPTKSEVSPELKSVHITTGAKPNTEPTERSNSPAVMSSVMARAISPSSTVKVSVFEMLSGDRNAGLIPAKTAISKISSTKGPNSGAAMMRRRVEVCVKSDHRKGAAEGLSAVGSGTRLEKRSVPKTPPGPSGDTAYLLLDIILS